VDPRAREGWRVTPGRALEPRHWRARRCSSAQPPLVSTSTSAAIDATTHDGGASLRRTMCELLNLFVPRKVPELGPPVRHLSFGDGGEIHEAFAALYAGRGAVLAASSKFGCLCGFNDWDAVYETARDLVVRNAVSEIVFLRFWSGDRYKLRTRTVDPDDAESCRPLERGEVVVVHTGPPEQRRHRLVVRSLVRAVGEKATLRLKGGRTLSGTVTAFDEVSETGAIGDVAFVAGQVMALER
jgi:hypothetical protein